MSGILDGKGGYQMKLLLKLTTAAAAGLGAFILSRKAIELISGQPGEIRSGSYDTWPPVPPASAKRN